MKIKILIVDDEKNITDMMVRYFSFEGYDVTGCNDPVEALEMIKNDNYLICILDIQMPKLNGTDLLKEIKLYNGMIGVIMMTAYATTENVLTCLRRGAETCFLKPIDDLEGIKKYVDNVVKRFNDWQNLIIQLKGSSSSTGNDVLGGKL